MVPSKEEFDTCINLMSNYEIYESYNSKVLNGQDCGDLAWVGEIRRELFLGEDVEHGRRLLSLAYEELSSRSRDIYATAVMVWLESSICFRRVYEKLFPHHVKLSGDVSDRVSFKEEFLKYSLARLRDAALAEDKYGIRFRSRVSRMLGNYGIMRWLREYVIAVREYFFEDSASAMLHKKKSFRSDMVSGVDAIKSLRRLADDPIIVKLLGRVLGRRRILTEFKSGDERCDELLGALEEISNIDPGVLYPISRLDATAKARVFVYRMADVNYMEFKSVKASQIAELMNLDGFDVRLDLRTIERQCAGFDAMKRNYWTQLEGTVVGAAYMSRLFGKRR